jgi:phosphate starvation-inducible membrane PsiE
MKDRTFKNTSYLCLFCTLVSFLFRNLLALLRVVKVEQERKMNVQLGEQLLLNFLTSAVYYFLSTLGQLS